MGDVVENFTEGKNPKIDTLNGKTVRIEKINPDHFEDLFQVYGELSTEDSLTYISFSKFNSKNEFDVFFQTLLKSEDPYYLAIVDNNTGKALGTFSLMRIVTKNRVVEMGWVVYSSKLKQTRIATEAQYLVMKYVFEELCYRRYEWKCDSLNAPSNNSAKRLGFTFEGTFRQAVVYKGRNRDTNWYSILDKEWPEKKTRFEKWLDDSNFDVNGYQIRSLSSIEQKTK
ncbi:TPA: GNAT family N-acetyltransferase [Streptococcus agalactiae]